MWKIKDFFRRTWLFHNKKIIAIAIVLPVLLVGIPVYHVLFRPLLPLNWTDAFIDEFVDNMAWQRYAAHRRRQQLAWEREQRNNSWERDVNFLANTFLREHPLLNDSQNAPLFTFKRTIGDLRSNVSTLTEVTNFHDFFDEQLKELFVDEINNLIENIPYLTDAQIVMGLSRSVALLGNAHCWVGHLAFLSNDQLPLITTRHFYGDVCWGHTRTVYAGISEINNMRIVSINGVCVKEIAERLRPYTSYYSGNDTSFRMAAGTFRRDILRYIGVMQNQRWLPVEFMDVYGNIAEIPIHFVESMDDMDLYAHQIDFDIWFSASRSNENYWYQYFYEESMMYVRFSRCYEMDNDPSTEFVARLKDDIISLGGVDTFVFDLRGNSGGYLLLGFDRLIRWAMDEGNRALLGQIYVAVDQWTFSNGVTFARLWQHFVEYVTIIGAPTRGNTNFFAGLREFTTPNFRISFGTSTMAFTFGIDPHENTSLIPDIFAPRTLAGYLVHYDAVISTIRQRQLERSINYANDNNPF